MWPTAAALKESFRVLKKGGKVSFAAWADATPSALRLLIDATGASAADFFPLATEGAAKEALVAAGFDGATFAFEAVPAHLPLTTGADCVAVFAAGGAPARRALAAADAATVGAQLASAVESSFVGTWQDASEMNWNKDEIHATVPGTGWAATSGYAARIGALGEGTVAGADHARTRTSRRASARSSRCTTGASPSCCRCRRSSPPRQSARDGARATVCERRASRVERTNDPI